MKEELRDWRKYTLILVLILVITGFHYGTSVHKIYLHEIYQRTYYIPIVLAAFWYGPVGGVAAAMLTSGLYVYHIEKHWAHFPVYWFNQYAEIILYHVVAVIVGYLSLRERRQRRTVELTSRQLAQAYEQVQQKSEQLRQADRLASLGQLSAGVAHEIRNPLGSIKGSIEILETEFPENHAKREFVEIIKEETARLNSIVSEFLKFARPPKPSMEPASITELIDSTVVLLKQRAEQSGVKLVVRNQCPLPSVELDKDQIRQVLLNIMLNGIEAMTQGGTLEIGCRILDSEKALAIDISDTGNAQPPEDLDHLFDPFYTTKPHGTGLGLSISYQLVQNHGGLIKVSGNSQGGLTFRIQLPVARL